MKRVIFTLFLACSVSVFLQAQSIAGTWVFNGENVNITMLLNPNGTYSYNYSAERSGYTNNQSAYGGTSNQNGDQGIWKTDGITISSTSRTTSKTTRYSFSKENNENGDPMIVIGGKKNVTAYDRPRWQ